MGYLGLLMLPFVTGPCMLAEADRSTAGMLLDQAPSEEAFDVGVRRIQSLPSNKPITPAIGGWRPRGSGTQEGCAVIRKRRGFSLSRHGLESKHGPGGGRRRVLGAASGRLATEDFPRFWAAPRPFSLGFPDDDARVAVSGQDLRFYYYSSLAKAIGRTASSEWSERIGPLIKQVVALQRADGSWSNPARSMFEDDPLVASALAIEAISELLAAGGQ